VARDLLALAGIRPKTKVVPPKPVNGGSHGASVIKPPASKKVS
jgi:hypothetical protein